MTTYDATLIYDDAITYDSTSSSSNIIVTVGIKANIQPLQPTQTVTIQADILAKYLALLSLKARVSTKSTYGVSAKAHIIYLYHVSIKGAIQRKFLSLLTTRGRLIAHTTQFINIQASIRHSTSVNIKGHISQNSTYRVSMQGAIRAKSVCPLQVQARIKSYRQDLVLQALVLNDHWLSCKARISQQMGYPQPTPDAGNFLLFQPTAQQIKASIKPAKYSNQSIQFKGSVWWYRNFSLQLQAHLVRGSTLTMKGAIQPRWVSSSATMQFSVQNQTTYNARMLFYVGGNLQQQTLGLGAMIEATAQRTFTGHFIVSRTIANSNLGYISTTPRTTKVLQFGAYIN